ncbi:MAG: XkdX family protein [Ruminococcaceae bacterium]|nr:XkdX family protein [Oscillospiraceae bacterium]
MNRFEKVKKYFENGLWNVQRVANAVIKGWITVDEFREITGVVYDV